MGATTATYPDILTGRRRAAPDGVRCAYRKLAQRYHPDKLQGNADAVRIMAMLNAAYSVLSDPDRRASYDRAIARADARCDAATPPELRQASWPWYLLFATIAFTVASIGTVAYTMTVPAVAAPVLAGASK
jgi:hypothetical protein